QGDGERQREGNRTGDDQGAAQVAQEGPLQEKDEQYAGKDVMQHRVRRHTNEIGAIVDSLDSHTRWQNTAAVDRVDFSFSALDSRLGPYVHRLAADVHVAVVESLQHLSERQTVLEHAVLVDADFIRLRLSAPTRHVDHTRHGFEAALEDPILERFQVHGGVP